MDVRVEGPCCNFAGGGVHDPNGEWVCFRNYDSQPVDMNDWRVHDAAGHAYRFPPFVLAPGAIVRVHSGPGADIATDLYWGRGTVWNNDHDTVYLYDALSRLVSRYVY
jgi:competence protein ComEC